MRSVNVVLDCESPQSHVLVFCTNLIYTSAAVTSEQPSGVSYVNSVITSKADYLPVCVLVSC